MPLIFKKSYDQLEKEKNTLYDGFLKIINIKTKDGPREVMVRRSTVSILLYSDTHVLLVSQNRPGPEYDGFNETFYETIAGIIDTGETEFAAMQREVKEEVGIDIPLSNINKVGDTSLYLSPGGSNETMTLFLSKFENLEDLYNDKKRKEKMLANDDQIESHLLTWAQTKTKKIKDLKTVHLLQRARIDLMIKRYEKVLSDYK